MSETKPPFRRILGVRFFSGLPFRPLQRFLYVYLWQQGFLDGTEGYHFARLHAFYEYLCVVKTVELKKAKNATI